MEFCKARRRLEEGRPGTFWALHKVMLAGQGTSEMWGTVKSSLKLEQHEPQTSQHHTSTTRSSHTLQTSINSPIRLISSHCSSST